MIADPDAPGFRYPSAGELLWHEPWQRWVTVSGRASDHADCPDDEVPVRFEQEAAIRDGNVKLRSLVGPVVDEYGHPWVYSPARDMWFSDTTVFDWGDMRGWHPEVVDAWNAREDQQWTAAVAESPIAPLEDPTYKPKHPYVGGPIPDVIEKWGAASQLRWFKRYWDELRRPVEWHRYYCVTTAHKGGCCVSCIEDERDGYNDWGSEHCCCRGYRAANDA